MKKLLKVIGKSVFVLIGFLLLLFFTFYLLTIGNYEVAKTVEDDLTISHIEIENTVFHAETFGSDTNDIVIVLHGGPGNDFRYLLPLKELADDYFVVFYDQRGTGLSPRVKANEFTLENMLNDLNNIIDYYAQSRKVNIIGHSWGGMLASAYIGKYPSKVEKAVLAEPGMLTSEEAKEFMEKMHVKFDMDLILHMGKSWFQAMHVDGPDDQAATDFFFQSLMAEGIMKTEPYSAYYCDDDITNSSFDYWRFGGLASSASIRNAMDEDGNLNLNLTEGVENFTNKVLFIASECNTVIGIELQKEHLKLFPNAELVVIKNSGHMMFGEQPEESLKIIRKYFSEN